MNILDDVTFGKMEYRHSWVKNDTISWKDKKYDVLIIAKAYKNESILDSQRKMYEYFLNKWDEINVKVENKVKEYSTIENIGNINGVKPRTLIFERNNTWGVLFDCELEEGLAVFFIGENLEIGPEEMFI
jgi:hypothetical protein